MIKKTGISRCDTNFEPYLNWLKSGNLEYKILDYNENNFNDIKECSSLLLTGGVDVFPEFYNDWEDGNDRSQYKPERDGFEFKLLDYAFENKIPILGICRGLQLVNVLEGGKLVQDLDKHNEIHRISKTDDKQHEVFVEKNSLLHEITHTVNGIVNSAHHQAINKNELGSNLKVNAWSGTADPSS